MKESGIKKCKKRTLEELNVIDDFLLNEIITDKQYGNEFIHYFLKTVLGEEVTVKNVNAQVVATPGDAGKRAIRMDVVTEAVPSKGTIALKEGPAIDIEMQAQNKQQGIGQKNDLRKRSRLYQALIDVNQLETGGEFGDLGDVIIIICAPFDLFGENRAKYTFEHICAEEPELYLNDGAKRIFLNTKGQLGATKELQELLRYIERSTEENAISKDLQKIHRIVTNVKNAKERRERYMWAIEREQMMRDEGEERVFQLIRILNEASRMEDISRAVNDREYREKLFQEFGI